MDLHAITIPQDPGDLRRWKREAMATLLAVGLREERCGLFFQSEVRFWVCVLFLRGRGRGIGG